MNKNILVCTVLTIIVLICQPAFSGNHTAEEIYNGVVPDRQIEWVRDFFKQNTEYLVIDLCKAYYANEISKDNFPRNRDELSIILAPFLIQRMEQSQKESEPFTARFRNALNCAGLLPERIEWLQAIGRFDEKRLMAVYMQEGYASLNSEAGKLLIALEKQSDAMAATSTPSFQCLNSLGRGPEARQKAFRQLTMMIADTGALKSHGKEAFSHFQQLAGDNPLDDIGLSCRLAMAQMRIDELVGDHELTLARGVSELLEIRRQGSQSSEVLLRMVCAIYPEFAEEIQEELQKPTSLSLTPLPFERHNCLLRLLYLNRFEKPADPEMHRCMLRVYGEFEESFQPIESTIEYLHSKAATNPLAYELLVMAADDKALDPGSRKQVKAQCAAICPLLQAPDSDKIPLAVQVQPLISAKTPDRESSVRGGTMFNIKALTGETFLLYNVNTVLPVVSILMLLSEKYDIPFSTPHKICSRGSIANTTGRLSTQVEEVNGVSCIHLIRQNGYTKLKAAVQTLVTQLPPDAECGFDPQGVLLDQLDSYVKVLAGLLGQSNQVNIDINTLLARRSWVGKLNTVAETLPPGEVKKQTISFLQQLQCIMKMIATMYQRGHDHKGTLLQLAREIEDKKPYAAANRAGQRGGVVHITVNGDLYAIDAQCLEIRCPGLAGEISFNVAGGCGQSFEFNRWRLDLPQTLWQSVITYLKQGNPTLITHQATATDLIALYEPASYFNMAELQQAILALLFKGMAFDFLTQKQLQDIWKYEASYPELKRAIDVMENRLEFVEKVKDAGQSDLEQNVFVSPEIQAMAKLSLENPISLEDRETLEVYVGNAENYCQMARQRLEACPAHYYHGTIWGDSCGNLGTGKRTVQYQEITYIMFDSVLQAAAPDLLRKIIRTNSNDFSHLPAAIKYLFAFLENRKDGLSYRTGTLPPSLSAGDTMQLAHLCKKFRAKRLELYCYLKLAEAARDGKLTINEITQVWCHVHNALTRDAIAP